MTTDDAAKAIKEVRPELAVITHFGMQIILRNPQHEAELIEKKTGIPTKAASDGIHIVFGENISFTKPEKHIELNRFIQRSKSAN